MIYQLERILRVDNEELFSASNHLYYLQDFLHSNIQEKSPSVIQETLQSWLFDNLKKFDFK
jgi:hypothetical protein